MKTTNDFTNYIFFCNFHVWQLPRRIAKGNTQYLLDLSYSYNKKYRAINKTITENCILTTLNVFLPTIGRKTLSIEIMQQFANNIMSVNNSDNKLLM